MMRSMKMRAMIAALVTVGLLAATGCVRVTLPSPSALTDSDRIASQGATTLVATVEMGAGRLNVTGGADGAMDAEYAFTGSDLRPEVDYGVKAGEGKLSVRTPARPRLNLTGNIRYEWDIELSDSLPLDLSVTMGAGETDLDLRTLDLRRLQVQLGAGDATIELPADPTADLVADITAGVGALTVRVPAEVGVRIVGHRDGLGTYEANGFTLDGDALVNDAYADADVRYEITLRRGVGDVTVETVD